MRSVKMDSGVKIVLLSQVFVFVSLLICGTRSDEPRNLQNHRNGVLNLKDVADHWIGFPKSPYTSSFTVTAHPATSPATPPTSAPLSINKYFKQKKTKHKYSSNKRKDDDYDLPNYARDQTRDSNERPNYARDQTRDSNERPNYARDQTRDSNERPSYARDQTRDSNERPSYARDQTRDSNVRPNYRGKYQDYDTDFEYDYNDYPPMVSNPYSPSYVVQASSATPNTVYANPALSGNSQTLKAIYAGIPKVATYVVPNTKKYVVQRVKSEAVYMPGASSGSDLYAAASNRGMRRVDPMDYDDGVGGGGGGGGNSFLNLGPQEGFPPRPVMNKIAQPGQRQPCHGPDCHQHHKGLVRFYWRRVVYPPNERGRGRGRGRVRRPGGRGRRRRLRGNARAPSDQREVFYTDDDNEDTDDDEDNNPQENVNNEEIDEDEEEEDNQEEDTKRRNVWQPGRGYGHDLSEGSNYDEGDMKTYRDKRYAYRRRQRRRNPRPVEVYTAT